VTVIRGEGRVPILYGTQPMAIAPYRDGYVARPDTVAPHPAVAIATGGAPGAASKTLARHIARYGYAVVVPPADRRHLAAAVEAFGRAWGQWSRGDRCAVIGIGSGSATAVSVAAAGGFPVILLSPDAIGTDVDAVPTLILGPASVTPTPEGDDTSSMAGCPDSGTTPRPTSPRRRGAMPSAASWSFSIAISSP
jgi:hypothetical protein